MATALWTPRADGIRASIWEPGGAIPTALTCDLAELEALIFDGEDFADNFTDPDVTVLNLHTADSGEAWNQLGDGILSILAGSVVNGESAPEFAAVYETDVFEIPDNDGVTISVEFGAFSQEDFVMDVFCTSNVNTLRLSLASAGGVITATGFISGYDNEQTAPITLDYCTWSTVNLVYSISGAFLSLQYGESSEIVDVIDPDVMQGVNCTAIITATNIEGNGARLASMAITHVGLA